MNKKQLIAFITFNLLSFLSFSLVVAHPLAGLLSLGATAYYGFHQLPLPARQRPARR